MVARKSKAQTVRSRYLDGDVLQAFCILLAAHRRRVLLPNDEQPALEFHENRRLRMEKLGEFKVEAGRFEIQGGRMGMRASGQ